MRQERIDFYSASVEPIRLEGLLDLPEEEGPYPVGILCHPHPMGGGSMYVPLLEVLAHSLAGKGRACLRFNFRGVGRSSGSPTGGIQETEDVEGAFQWLGEREDIYLEDLVVSGWSFGSWVGLRWAVSSGNCRKAALVSPPLVGFDFFQFLDSDDAHLPDQSLIICGERDQFSDVGKLEELSQRLGAELRILPGADHFLFGREKEIADIVASHFT
jgi:alpha/beta superfamily hydrolase